MRGTPAAAQGAPALRLQTANASVGEEFTEIISTRELADGRLLLFDRGEDRFTIADFTSGTVRDVSRKGRGPGEYQGPLGLWPLGGDSTLAADLILRWLYLVGDSVVTTTAPDDPVVHAVSLSPRGTDLTGHVATTKPIRRPGAESDSQKCKKFPFFR